MDIPPNEIMHKGIHTCKSQQHQCGFQCKQCEYYCIKEYGHDKDNLNRIINNKDKSNDNNISNNGNININLTKKNKLHNCHHGNMKYSSIYIIDQMDLNNKESYAMIQKEDKLIKFKGNEDVKISFYDEYCKEQGQGHVHIIESYNMINNNEIRFLKYNENTHKYTYECKCSFFWEKVLQFESNIITDNDKKIFNLCNWKCPYASHEISKNCQLDLWHEPTKIIPKGKNGVWVSKDGHVFDCIHPHGIYSIFLLDTSGSMKSKSQMPNEPKIKKKLPNMLGAAIQAIDTYCKLRAYESKIDKCALYGFNNKAYEVFTDIDVENTSIILNECFNKLKPDGCTLFKNAFEKAFNFISNPNFDRNKFIPVIILLTDGLDHGYEETLTYVKNVRFFI